MPVQRSILGKPLPQLPPRRMASLLATIAFFAVVILIFTLPSSIPAGPSLGKFTDHKISIPKFTKQLTSPSLLNPFAPAAHPPPVQKNSTNGESKWYSDWKWLSPFSSSVTLDENRSLLPPLLPRTPIYAYYDHTTDKDAELKEAQNAILLTWRRAWWAQGFRPIILSPADAMKNPLYTELQMMKDIEAPLKIELSRWLAWENMGTGILSNYLTIPMGPHDDPLLAFLRRGEYPQLTRFDKLGSGIFAGATAHITAGVKEALANPNLKNSKDFISAVDVDTFEIDPHHQSLAYYDTEIVTKKYPNVADDIVKNGAKGLQTLNKLIIAHLHSTWQNMFSEGIAVLKPLPNHMSAAIEPAWQLATFLAQCPESPIPASCPPNRPKCTPCVASTPLSLTTPPSYRNTSGLYSIGTVPHPYTLSLLKSLRSSVDVPWIRRFSPRDLWLSSLTNELCGTGVSGAPRVVKFKEAVASEHGTAHSLWVTAEKDVPIDLDWHFGFAIPRNATDRGRSETPVPGPERRPQPEADPRNGPVAEPVNVGLEKEVLQKAIEFGKTRNSDQEKVRGAIEAWNLADTEAWKFARAWLARSRMERLQWEEEEKKYAGGAGAERGKSKDWGRWFDD